MSPLSRRVMLSAATLTGLTGAARAAGFGNPDSPAEGAVNASGPNALSDLGPRNPALAAQFPSIATPPPTDINGMDLFWSSFNNAHRRIQSGGWAREVTVGDFAASKTIAGVNMRLAPGGVRELHWHQQAEWAVMVAGRCRVTVLDEQGRPAVEDLAEGDLWYFPAGLPHSLQGLGPDGAEFVLAFDNGAASEFNTLMLTDWIAHTPPEVLAKNFGVPADSFSRIRLHNLWIFQSGEPGPLAADRQSVQAQAGVPPHPFVFRLSSMPPTKHTRGGTVRIADSTNFTVSTTIAAALVTVEPGGLREMHWHPNADEWQYWLKGRGRMTVFNTGPQAQTNDFAPGDVGYVRKSLGHYIENTGPDELVFMEIFRTDRYAEISLSDWLAHTPPALVAAHLNIDPKILKEFPRDTPDVVPL